MNIEKPMSQYQQERIINLLKWLCRIQKCECEGVGECIVCEAAQLLREIGENHD